MTMMLSFSLIYIYIFVKEYFVGKKEPEVICLPTEKWFQVEEKIEYFNLNNGTLTSTTTLESDGN